MKIIEDRRMIPSNVKCPNVCKVGDLYKPWYFYENSVIGSPKNINQVCLVYRIQRMSLNPNDIPATSYLKVPTKDDFDTYYSEELTKSIEKNGQKLPIICTKHCTLNAPINVGFLEDPELKKIHCFEGHHRVVSTKELKRDVIADVYSLYHMETPIDYSKHFNSIYNNSFWSSFQTNENRKPWFKEEQFVEFNKTYKYTQLSQCFDFIKGLNLNLTNGIDVGCAEGAYTFFANSILGIPMKGVDLEPGRIIRGLLMKIKFDKEDINFNINKWEDESIDYKSYDFGMLLSILHHINDPKEFLSTVIENKKALIIEARISSSINVINSGTIKSINTKPYYENIFKDLNLNYKHITTLGDRAFYVIWR